MNLKRTKNKVNRRLVTTAIVGTAIAAVCAYLRMQDVQAGNSLLSAFSDGCFIGGILLLGTAGLVFASNDGFFSIFSYGIGCAVRVMFRRSEDMLPKKSFPEYREERTKKKTPVGHFLTVGAALLLLAILFAAASGLNA